MQRRLAFTLLEILAVITIILVLAAISFPAFTASKESAKKTQCVSNLNQLALAVTMYRGEYSGDGSTGDMYAMGLPSQPILSSLPVSKTLNSCSGADKLPGLSPNGFPYIYIPTPPGQTSGAITWSDYATQYGEQAVLFIDLNHNPAGTPWDAVDVSKFGMAVCIDTHVVRTTRAGNPFDFPTFWNQ